MGEQNGKKKKLVSVALNNKLFFFLFGVKTQYPTLERPENCKKNKKSDNVKLILTVNSRKTGDQHNDNTQGMNNEKKNAPKTQ